MSSTVKSDMWKHQFPWRLSKPLQVFASLLFIQLLIAAVGFITRIKIANVLGKDAFGNLAFAMSVGTCGAMFTSFGMDKSLVRDFVHHPNEDGVILKASTLIKTILFSCFLVALPVIPLFVDLGRFEWAFVFVALATALQAFNLRPLYDAWQQMQIHSFFFLIQRTIYFALIWFVLLQPVFLLNPERVGVFMLISVILGLSLQYRWMQSRLSGKASGTLQKTVRLLLKSNFLIWVAVLGGLSIDWFTPIFIKCFVGSVELGDYSAAWLIIQLGVLCINQIGRIGSAEMARITSPHCSRNQQVQFLIKYLSLMLFVGIVVGLPCIVFPKDIMMIFSNEYHSAASILRVLGFYLIIFGPYLVLLQFIVCTKLHKSYLLSTLAAGFISIAISSVLIPKYGGLGASWSVVLSILTGFILFLCAVVKKLNFKQNTAG